MKEFNLEEFETYPTRYLTYLELLKALADAHGYTDDCSYVYFYYKTGSGDGLFHRGKAIDYVNSLTTKTPMKRLIAFILEKHSWIMNSTSKDYYLNKIMGIYSEKIKNHKPNDFNLNDVRNYPLKFFTYLELLEMGSVFCGYKDMIDYVYFCYRTGDGGGLCSKEKARCYIDSLNTKFPIQRLINFIIREHYNFSTDNTIRYVELLKNLYEKKHHKERKKFDLSIFQDKPEVYFSLRELLEVLTTYLKYKDSIHLIMNEYTYPYGDKPTKIDAVYFIDRDIGSLRTFILNLHHTAKHDCKYIEIVKKTYGERKPQNMNNEKPSSFSSSSEYLRSLQEGLEKEITASGLSKDEWTIVANGVMKQILDTPPYCRSADDIQKIKEGLLKEITARKSKIRLLNWLLEQKGTDE